MKKVIFTLVIIFLNSTLTNCSKSSSDDSNDPIATDISVTASVSYLLWTDAADLTQKINNVLNYNYGAASITEVTKELTFTPDSSQVTATISFKAGFQSKYIDTNVSNNSVVITLEQESSNDAVVLSADGPGDTYELITSVLAPGYNPVEVPDCNHAAFGRHIDEVFDNDLNTNVFSFHMHVTPDNDRCINFDRQRNEIKTYDQSPDNLLGVENETVEYKWKFKLSTGFLTSPNFTHIHQLKSVGDSFESMPMYTLTLRKGSPDQLQLRYAETGSQITVSQTDLAPLIGTWLEVTEIINYSMSGSYEIVIKQVSNGTVLFSYSNTSFINWRPGAEYIRPKWGIYRSLLNAQDLRDEILLFADFSIKEL